MVGVNLHLSNMEAVTELRTEQKDLSRLQRSSTVIWEAISEITRIDRVQRNLKLGGNTDIIVRPKLTTSRLRAFCFG